jgi:hypothetical protein
MLSTAALFDALSEFPIRNEIMTQGDLDLVFEASAISPNKAPNFESKRGAEFIRNVRLGKE